MVSHKAQQRLKYSIRLPIGQFRNRAARLISRVPGDLSETRFAILCVPEHVEHTGPGDVGISAKTLLNPLPKFLMREVFLERAPRCDDSVSELQRLSLLRVPI
jgi:hypothetical protein